MVVFERVFYCIFLVSGYALGLSKPLREFTSYLGKQNLHIKIIPPNGKEGRHGIIIDTRAESANIGVSIVDLVE